jgi:hypothetical protein
LILNAAYSPAPPGRIWPAGFGGLLKKTATEQAMTSCLSTNVGVIG